MITNEELMQIRERCDAATPGPWIQGMVSGQCRAKHQHSRTACVHEFEITADSKYEREQVSIAPNVTLIGSDDHGTILSEQNAAFIAAARTDVPALLDEVARLRELVVEGHYQLDGCMVERRVAIEMARTATAERDTARTELARLETQNKRLTIALSYAEDDEGNLPKPTMQVANIGDGHCIACGKAIEDTSFVRRYADGSVHEECPR